MRRPEAASLAAPATTPSFVFVFAMPSRYSEWLEAIVARLLAAAGKPAGYISAETFGHFGRAVYERQLLGGVAAARAPQSDIVAAVRQIPSGCIVALSDPADCLADLIADHGVAAPAAARFIANSIAALQAAADARTSFVVIGPDTSALDLTRRAVDAFDLRLAPEIVAGVAADSLILTLERRAKAERLRDNESCALMWDAVRPLWDALSNGVAAQTPTLTWGRELFVSPEHGQLPATIDVTGAARFLVYGPYIRLPAGDWSCGLRVKADPRGDSFKLLVEAVCGSNVSRARFNMRRAGVFELEFCFACQDLDAPVEIRVYIEQAVFDGALSIECARLTRLAAMKAYPEPSAV